MIEFHYVVVILQKRIIKCTILRLGPIHLLNRSQISVKT